MKILYISSNIDDGISFKEIAEGIAEIDVCKYFTSGYRLLKCLQTDDIDIVFIHINIKNKNVKDLFEKIKEINGHTEVVFVTDFKGSQIKAFEMDALGYITTPLSEECINNIIKKAHKLHFEEKRKPVIRTFGNFDIFINDKVVLFSNKKAKELLALLVDKCGGCLNMEQIIDVLWEDRPFDDNTKVLYRIALKNLRDTLEEEGCADILIEKRGQRSINVNKVKCDYYDLISGKNIKFLGDYMTNYSWGEYTLAKLFDKYY